MSTTPYMGLTLPTPSSTVGPTWASQINSALGTVDGHNHSSGSGNRVPTSGLNINADLTFVDYNATNVRSLRFYDQGSAIALSGDVGCVYIAGGDLYYNNGSGTPIQLTSGAALNAASIGGIGGDYATSSASCFYTAASTTFSFTSAANSAASIDAGNVIIREPGVASAFGITVKSTTGLGAAYDLTLPSAVPLSALPVQMSSTGALSTATISTAQIADSAVTTAKIASAAVTAAKMDANAGVFVGAAHYNVSGTLISSVGQISWPASIAQDSLGWSIAVAGLTTSAIVVTSPADANTTAGNLRSAAYVSVAGTLRVFAANGSSLLGFSVVVLKL